MVLKKIRLTTFGWLVLLVLLSAASIGSAQVSTVGSSTLSTATKAEGARKTFFDSSTGKFWAFYSDGSGIAYASSDDAQSWTSGGSSLPYNTTHFSVAYKIIGSTPYVFIGVETNSKDIALRRGVLSRSGITFDSEVLAYGGITNSLLYTTPSVSISSDNYLWIGAVQNTVTGLAGSLGPVVERSQSTADTTLGAFTITTRLGRNTQPLKEILLLPQNNGEMYLLVDGDGQNIVGYHYDGATWSSALTGGDLSWFSFGGGTINGSVKAIALYQSEIYIGGNFLAAGSNPSANYLAKWNGSAWVSVGALNGDVLALTTNGTSLYVGGAFSSAGGVANTSHIATYTSGSWGALSTGVNTTVRAIAITGNTIYAGGDFTSAGSVSNAGGIAFWDGANWNAMGGGVSGGSVNALATDGTNLFVGGSFTLANGVTNTAHIANWVDSSWSPLQTGLNGSVNSLLVSGTELYVGGAFTSAGGVSGADHIAHWSIVNSGWSALGTGLNNSVDALAIDNTDLYVGGSFTNAGGNSGVDRIARFDLSGQNWNSVSAFIDAPVSALLFATGTGGPTLYAGGSFNNAGQDLSADRIAKYNLSTWSGFSKAPDINGKINAMAIFNGALYLGGNFTEAGGNHFANYLAAYDGTNWFPVGGGSINGPVNALLTLGTNLYIGGSFTSVFGVQDNSGITRFDGSNFSPLNLGVNDAVFALGAIGSNLYVGGQFTGPVTASIASPNTSGILLWDGSSWSALGSGIPATPGSSYVSSIATIGTDVYVGGRFASAGGVSNTGNIARWDSSTGVTGSTWNSLGTSLNGDVNALLALSPSSLMVGGAFTNAGGNSTANYIAKWDPTNSSWSGLSGGLNNTVTAISSINNILYVGGKFTSAGGNSPANYLATFDGTSWSHVGNGPDGPSSAIAQFGGTIYIGGTFTAVQGARSPNFAAYGTSISGPGGVDQISATSDGKGNLYLAYTDESANVNFRGYNATTSSWSPSRLIANSPVLNSVAVSINAPVNDLIISYAKNGAVNFVRGKSPYSSVSDFTSEATLFSGATSDFVAGSEGVGSNGKFVEIFTSVTGQSYTVNSATITTVGSISGVVTLNGTPLSGVTIDGGALGTTTTDGGGAYLFSSIPYGTTFSLVPQKTGYVITPSPSAGSVTGSITSNFTATLASYSIGGIISIGGTPLAGALVDGGPLGTQITASDGSYSFTALYGTPYRFTPSLAGYSFTPPSVNSTVTGQSAVNFAGSPNRYPLSGVVMTTTGKPVPGVLVTSPQFPSTTTDTNGVFVFNNVTFGTSFQITVKRDGFNFTQSQQSGTVGVNTRLTFTADPQLFTISGKVITDAGAPLSGATINGGPLGTATSDASGQYSFTKVPFGVPYTIKAMIQGYSISPFAATGRVSGDANNNFIATAARVTLSGAVQLRGKPLAGVVVDGGSLGKQTTKADGKFSFPNLTPGTSFSLTPTLQGYSFAPSGVAGILTKDTSITFKISTKQAYGGAVIRASIASDGTESDGASSEALLSGDGTAAVFTSAASSLVDGDTNQHRDVFVRNISSATTTRISVSGNGDEGNDDSGVQVGSERSIAISNDGTLVAYSTNASNLVVDDLNSASDVLLYSALTNGQTLISSAAGGAQGDGASYGPSLSSSGSKVAFTSLATNLVSSDTNGVADVFVKTVSDGTIQRASTAADGSEANGASGFASLSGDGSIVAFSSTATNLVSSDTNGASDIFVKNLSSGSISRASVSSAGVEANGPSTLPVISGNGKFVAFQSTASNLVSGDSNGVADVFVKDLSTGAIERVSVTSSGEEANGASGTSIAISVDGRYVAFSSDATNLVPNDTDGVRDIFVHDRVTNRTGVISRAVNGAQATGASRNCWMSMDGQFYSFVSDAPNLISDDKNGVADVFVSVLPDLPQTFQAKSKIQNPPVLVVDSKNVTIVMQLFYIKGTPRSIEPLLNDKKSSKTTSITYSVTIKNTSVKNDIKKLTSKKNTLTLKNVDKGKYKVTYQAQTTQGSTVVSSTKASPTRTFSVVQ